MSKSGQLYLGIDIFQTVNCILPTFPRGYFVIRKRGTCKYLEEWNKPVFQFFHFAEWHMLKRAWQVWRDYSVIHNGGTCKPRKKQE
jgi:hypothetical protein